MSKREIIYNSAIKLVCEEGLHSLSLTKLASLTGLSKQLIKYYFSDLNDLLFELFEFAGRKGQKLTINEMHGKTEPIAKLSAMIEAMMNWAASGDHYGRFFLLIYHLAPADEKLSRLHKEILNTGLERIRLILFEMMKFKDRNIIESKAIAIHNLMIGTVFRMVSQEDYEHCDFYKTALNSAIGQILEETFPDA